MYDIDQYKSITDCVRDLNKEIPFTSEFVHSSSYMVTDFVKRPPKSVLTYL